MERASRIRNIAIVVAIATAIYAIPSGDFALSFLSELISLAFLAALAWGCLYLYREHRIEIEALPQRERLLLYGAIGVCALTLAATSRLWASGLGTVAWLLLLCACAYAAYHVYRTSRSY